jgi:hypothetical protein
MQNRPALSSFDRVKLLLYGSCDSCQILLYVAAAAAYQLRIRLGQNLKKLQIYDIIKGWGYRPAQQI